MSDVIRAMATTVPFLTLSVHARCVPVDTITRLRIEAQLAACLRKLADGFANGQVNWGTAGESFEPGEPVVCSVLFHRGSET